MMHGWQSELMDRKVVGVVLYGMVAVVTSPTTAGCSVACSCNCSCSGNWCSTDSVVVVVVTLQCNLISVY